MRTLICLVASVLLLSAPIPAAGMFGGGSDEGPDLWGDLEFKPVVGQWAEYQMTPKGEKTMKMRFAVVGKEDDAHWLEYVMTGHEGEQMISKMLVTGDPEDMSNIKRMIVKNGDEPAMEMPVQMMAMMEGKGMPEPEKAETPEPKMTDAGVESVTVPAGTFKANHWQFGSEGDTFDAWLKDGVGPYGLIKGSSKEFEMVLVGHGDKATTLITETPQAFPMQGSPMGGMGGQ